MLNIGIKNFHSNFFEKNIFFQKNAVSDHVISWSKLNEVLYGWDLDSSEMRLFFNGLLHPSQYTTRYQDIDTIKNRLNKEVFDSYLRSGATLVLNRVDEKNIKIGALCKVLSDFTGLKTVANGYAAFGGDGTFGKHWDTHDVFAVQLLGRKRWQVFMPTFELPLPNQKSKNLKSDCPTDSVFDEILEPGDLLYIPRGWWHEASPIPGQETFHIAAGVHTAKAIDYLSWLVDQILPSIVQSRRSLTAETDFVAIAKEFSSVLVETMAMPEHLHEFIKQMEALNNVYEPIDLPRVKSST